VLTAATEWLPLAVLDQGPTRGRQASGLASTPWVAPGARWAAWAMAETLEGQAGHAAPRL